MPKLPVKEPIPKYEPCPYCGEMLETGVEFHRCPSHEFEEFWGESPIAPIVRELLKLSWYLDNAETPS